jgi:transposase
VLEPLLREVESLNERIREYDQRMEQIAKQAYPEVALLKQVKGVETQIALTYRLTIDDPHRFAKSRDVGCFLGLHPDEGTLDKANPRRASVKRATEAARFKAKTTFR